MPRPTTRAELIDAANSGFEKLNELIDAFPDSLHDSEFPFEDRDRRVRDVVAHLAAWHRMMLRWYAEGMAGAKPAIPAEGHTWQTTPALNATIWQDAQSVGLVDARSELRQTHAEVMALIETHSEEELFTKKRYAWTGSTSLGAYLISATSSHYDWAMKKLRKAKRAFAT
ncbi:MAG: ClbS/DfsB family four-helix bundle protein [Bifidobacteriaceae bacterium]|jgi:hypothetical protein|nr:ClbS/DfsB family four-helix bundle protein [Bifidobacteriaceae bacterium]